MKRNEVEHNRRTARQYSSSAARENPVGSCTEQIERDRDGGIGAVCIYRSSSLSDDDDDDGFMVCSL